MYKIWETFVIPDRAKDFFQTLESIDVAEQLLDSGLGPSNIPLILNYRNIYDKIDQERCWPATKYLLLCIVGAMSGESLNRL